MIILIFLFRYTFAAYQQRSEPSDLLECYLKLTFENRQENLQWQQQ